MRRTDFIEGFELPGCVEAFAQALLELGNVAQAEGRRDVEVTARDAAEGLLALLDVLEHRRRTVELRTV